MAPVVISPGHSFHRPVVLSPSNLIDNWTPACLPLPGCSPTNFIRPTAINTSPQMGKSYKRVPQTALLLTTAEDEKTVEQNMKENIEKAHYSLVLLSSMALSSILFALVALVFFLMTTAPPGPLLPPAKSYTHAVRPSPVYPMAVELLQEIVNSLDIIVLVTSLAAFFCSTVQLYFSLRQLKHDPTDAQRVLDYLQSKSFMRIVVYSFWFTSVLAFIVVIVLTALLSPYRGSISKGVGLSAGVTALVLCGIGLLRSAWFFSKSTLMATRTIRKFENYSTLV